MAHDFRFVIDGLELSEEDQDMVARAVQEAGMRAVVGLTSQRDRRFEIDRDSYVAVDFGALGRRWEWMGREALFGEAAIKAAEHIAQGGILSK